VVISFCSPSTPSGPAGLFGEVVEPLRGEVSGARSGGTAAPAVMQPGPTYPPAAYDFGFEDEDVLCYADEGSRMMRKGQPDIA
jgi:hypothetical protein